MQNIEYQLFMDYAKGLCMQFPMDLTHCLALCQ